jgi:CHAD domain-containing protein
MKSSNKWISGIDADTSLRKAARVSLRTRLAAVWYYLPLAAEQADDNVEYVHQLRVSTRRALAALRLYGRLCRKRDVRWFRTKLKQIRRAAGDARDMDVLGSNPDLSAGAAGDMIAEKVRNLREVAQLPISSVHDDLRRKQRWLKRVRRLLKAVRRTKHKKANSTFGRFARKQLKAGTQCFEIVAAVDGTDIGQLHQFRIHGKELRYLLELLAPAFTRRLKTRVYPIVEELQERLGGIHDAAVARDRFVKWAEESDDPTDASMMRELSLDATTRQHRLTAEFQAWWTVEKQQRFRRNCRNLLAH